MLDIDHQQGEHAETEYFVDGGGESIVGTGADFENFAKPRPNVHPSFSIDLISDKLVWTVDYEVFWRHSSNDGVYATNASPIFPSGGVRDKFIGHQPATDIYYSANQHLAMRAMFIWFISGNYLKQVGPGNDIVFVGLTTQLRF